MKQYKIVDSLCNWLTYSLDTYEQAKQWVEDFESQDKRDNEYIKDRYCIVEEVV